MFINSAKIRFKKSSKRIIKSLAVFLLVASWLLTGYPGFWLPIGNNKLTRFPKEVEKVYAGQQVYTSGSGNFTPTFTGSYLITLVGGGGGGAGGSSSSFYYGGGGGGGGALLQKTVTLTASTNYAYSVGTAGSGGGAGANGTAGGSTTFTVGGTTYTAGGGGGGYTPLTYTGGTAGTATGGDVNRTGGTGATGTTTYGAGGGSGAGTSANGNNGSGTTGGAAVSSYGGKGGNGTTSKNGSGSAGEAYGGGGGGGTGKSGTGANGYAGYIIITWTDPNTTTLSTSSDPGAITVAPASGIRSAGQFTFTTDTGSDTITALTLTLGGSPAGSYDALSSVEIRATSCAGTLYFSGVTPTGDSVSFSGGTALPVSTGGNTYLICVTPKDHTLASGTYSVSPYVSSTWTSSNGNIKTGSDTNANALTIDNTAPNSATSYSGTEGNASNTLNWTTSDSSDFNTTSGSVVYRWASGTAGSEVPAEASTPSAGDTNGAATVACVISSAASSAQSKVDGTGGSAGCTTTALTNGQQYIYKVFQKDNYGNYDTGVTIGPLTPTAASATFTQNKYRWYYDNDAVNPTAAWGALAIAENTAIPVIPAGYDPPDTTQELRLRINMVVNTAALSASEKYFKLEYKAGTDGSCTSGSWTDVGSGVWTFATSSVTDGSNITVSLSDTTSGKGEQYVKAKPSALNNAGASIGEIVEYDFHIIGSSAVANTTYSFRVVETDSGGIAETTLDAYTNCPTLTTEPGTANLMRHGQVFTNEVKQGFFWTN